MMILKIIHGYPPLYNAGYEVYSQTLCHSLAKNHEVCVITREENSFTEVFSLNVTQDSNQPPITLHKINTPLEKYRYHYQHSQINELVAILLDRVKPDLVYIRHVNHLSTSLVRVISKNNIPIVYTLHEYWLICLRGQFIQATLYVCGPLLSLCNGQEDKKCVQYCCSGYFLGNEDETSLDTTYWAGWINRRMHHVNKMVENIKHFVSSSCYLYNKYVKYFGLPRHKMIYLNYGFDLNRLTGRKCITNEPVTFGYIGTHIPAKGIQLLIKVFYKLGKNCKLRILVRPKPQNTDGLHAITSKLPFEVQSRIEWLPEYISEKIVSTVFNRVDYIIVP